MRKVLVLASMVALAGCSSKSAGGDASGADSADSVIDSEAGETTDTGVASETSTQDSVASEASGDVSAVDGDAANVPTEFVVLRVGDGTSAITNSPIAYPTILEKRLLLDGSLVTSLAAMTTPTDGDVANPLTVLGLTIGGALALSPDKKYLTFAGCTLLADADAKSVWHPVAASVDSRFLVVDTSTIASEVTPDSLDTDEPLSALRDGANVWISYGSGLDFITFGASTGTFIADFPSLDLQIFNGQLYATVTLDGTVVAVGSGLPTSLADGSPLAGNAVAGMTPSRYSSGFVFFDLATDGASAPNRLYVANTSEGLQRWDLVSGSWQLTDTLDSGSGYAYVTGFVSSGTTVTLIATTADGSKIVRFVDDGTATGDTGVAGTVLVYGPTDDTGALTQVYRGVSLPPQ